MMGLCLGVVAGAATAFVALPDAGFELRWSRPADKVEWREEWRVQGAALMGVEARIRGPGARRAAPDFARPAKEWLVWPLPPVAYPRLTLARSEAMTDHRLCVKGECRGLAHYIGGTGPVIVEVCHAP